MRKKSLTEQQVAQCSKLAELRKQLGLTQADVAAVLQEVTDSESATRGRVANWEYMRAPVPKGIWKKLPAIFSRALEVKTAQTESALALIADIKEVWNSPSMIGGRR